MKSDSEVLCHAIKALSYRFKRVIAGSKDNFGDFRIADHVRTPNEIINHMYDLLIKTKMMIKEGHFNSPPQPIMAFQEEVDRFLQELVELHMLLTKREIPTGEIKKLLQGPILDVATHIGQIAMLNGLNGNKILKENYYAAKLK